MEIRRFASFALLFLAASPALLSQTLTGSDAEQSQQYPAVNCADPSSSAEAGCAQDLQQSMQQSQQNLSLQNQSQQPLSLDGSRMNPLKSLGSSSADETTISGQERNKAQKQAALLPPDQPTEFQKFVAATTGQLLVIYGQDLFRNVPTTFAPSNLSPVTSDYVIGPDDELRIRIWGQINFSGNVRVDRSGNIYLPQVGVVGVAGLQFSALDKRLREAVGANYRNFDLSVDMGRIRSIQVYVTGRARRPGVYTVSSLSSLVDALFASGGPSLQGSLRHILVKRDGKTVADFDLYALLMRGDKSHDVRLLPEDVLYIPPVGPQAAITGSINNPGIYELRDGDTIQNLIDAAGSASEVASSSRISLERLEEPQHRQAMEFGLDATGLSTPLAGGDILRISAILPAYQKTVTLRGNVANPGRFGWHSGMHLSDLIPDQDSLISRDYWWKRSHLGLPAPEFEPIISAIGEIQRHLESGALGPIRARSLTQESLTYLLTPSEKQSSDSPNNDSSQSGQNGQYGQNGQGQYGQMGQSGQNGQMGNSGALGSQPAQSPAQGNTGKPRLNTIRLAAPEINWNYAVIERTDPATLQSSLIPFDLGRLVLNHDAAQDLLLQPGDTITIFSQADIRVPIDLQVKYVKLEGEFAHPGFYSVMPDETLRDLVRRAGGLTHKAYLYGSEFTRESTRLLQQQRLDEYARTISMEAERGTQELAMAATSASSAQDVAASRTASQGLVARLSQIHATGRIVLHFQPNSSAIEDVPALDLQDGDKFVVPDLPSTVNVIGAVYDQNSFLYQKGHTVGEYLKTAGGANRNADVRHSFVIRADGSVVSSMAVKGTGFWGNGFNQLRLHPGDTIVVPDKTLHPTALRNFMDWTQIFSQLALGAAAINVL
jgi:protein involved in polysaccharide export with SLBB domain